MRAVYKTSRLAAKNGARTFDVGAMTHIRAVVPGVDELVQCSLHGDRTLETTNVKVFDCNGDPRFEFDITKEEAQSMADLFEAIGQDMR